ncbi:MAG: DUF3850 domain-containing protein [Rhizobiales bacterium]|nr:DUF3850 domain-containing protein [Hyphomicrobiales bacterium]
MRRHSLKIWPQLFEQVLSGAMTCMLRRNDRGFEVGDELLLEEFRYRLGEYTGRKCRVRVTHMWVGDEYVQFGLMTGFALLSIEHVDALQREAEARVKQVMGEA